MDVKLHPVSEIKPYQDNAKDHSRKQIQQIAASIREFGFNQPLVVDKDNISVIIVLKLNFA